MLIMPLKLGYRVTFVGCRCGCEVRQLLVTARLAILAYTIVSLQGLISVDLLKGEIIDDFMVRLEAKLATAESRYSLV